MKSRASATSSASTTGTCGARSQSSGLPPRAANPSSSEGRCVSANRSGEKKIGSQPSAISAASDDVLRPDRCEVDGDDRPDRAQDQLERLAEPRCVRGRVGDVVVRPVVLERLLPCEDRADDRDVLACPRERLAPGLAVPALGDLWAGRAEPEQHPTARERVERRHRRGGRGRAPGGHLHDRRAELDVRRARADPGERADRVRAVRLRRPHGIEAAALRLFGQPGPEHGVVVAQLEPEAHVRRS